MTRSYKNELSFAWSNIVYNIGLTYSSTKSFNFCDFEYLYLSIRLQHSDLLACASFDAGDPCN